MKYRTTGIYKKWRSHTKTENTSINYDDMETRKNTLRMVRRNPVPNIQKRGLENNAIITEGYPYLIQGWAMKREEFKA